jgi:transposase
MLTAQGLDITRAVLKFWVGYAVAELKPVYLRLRELILASSKIAVDETVARCSIPAMAAPSRATSGPCYAPGRGAVHGLKLLEGYHGIVQCDGYAAYKKIAAAPGEAITLAFCWTHHLLAQASRRAG